MLSSRLPALALSVPLAVVLVFAYFVKRRKEQSSKPRLPPGPKPHWLFGNEFPKAEVPKAFAQWGKEYGPLFSLWKGNTVFVIICGQQAAIDVMEKENAFTSDRPRNIAAGEILSGNMRLLLVGHGDRFRRLRKAIQSQVHINVVEGYEPMQAHHARNLVLDILDQPDNHMDHARRYAASLVMTMAYGKQAPTSYSDPEIRKVNQCLARLGKTMVPGTYLVDSYPIMQYIPGYLSELQKYHEEELALFKSQLEGVREKMRNGTVQPCFAKYLMERQRELGLEDNEIIYLAGSLFGAGSDTTAAAISVMIMAAALFPEAQRQVQEQLDMIVGRNRMPSFGDMNDLTLVIAFYLETFRWRPVSVNGVPHRVTKDIVYGRYVIPEGATVIAHHWSLGRDPEYYPEPEKFLPSRWLTDAGGINEKMKFYNFGFGRRVCPGQHLAKRSLFLNTASLLWAFNIYQDPSSPINADAFEDTGNSRPLPFRVKFEPRIPNLRDIVEKSN